VTSTNYSTIDGSLPTKINSAAASNLPSHLPPSSTISLILPEMVSIYSTSCMDPSAPSPAVKRPPAATEKPPAAAEKPPTATDKPPAATGKAPTTTEKALPTAENTPATETAPVTEKSPFSVLDGPHCGVLRGIAQHRTGSIEKMHPYYTDYLGGYVKKFFDIQCTPVSSFLFGTSRILVAKEGVFEMDESQDLLRFRGCGETVEEGSWMEMPDGEDD
jgi:hypothetical protein